MASEVDVFYELRFQYLLWDSSGKYCGIWMQVVIRFVGLDKETLIRIDTDDESVLQGKWRLVADVKEIDLDLQKVG